MTYLNDKQVEKTETVFEYDENDRIRKCTVTTTRDVALPTYAESGCSEDVDDGVLLEDTIEISEQSTGEKVLQALMGIALATSIVTSLYSLYKGMRSR